MSVKLDCQHNLSDDDCGKCSIMGYIFDCPAECEDYTDFFGNKSFAKETEIEKRLRGE